MSATRLPGKVFTNPAYQVGRSKAEAEKASKQKSFTRAVAGRKSSLFSAWSNIRSGASSVAKAVRGRFGKTSSKTDDDSPSRSTGSVGFEGLRAIGEGDSRTVVDTVTVLSEDDVNVRLVDTGPDRGEIIARLDEDSRTSHLVGKKNIDGFRKAARSCVGVKTSKWQAFKDRVTGRHSISREKNVSQGADGGQATNVILYHTGIMTSLSGDQVTGTTALGRELLTGTVTDAAQIVTDSLGLVSAGIGAGVSFLFAVNEFSHASACEDRVDNIGRTETVIKGLKDNASELEKADLEGIEELVTIAKEMNIERGRQQEVCALLDSAACVCATAAVVTSAIPPVAISFMAVGLVASGAKFVYKYGGAVKRAVKGVFSKSARAKNNERAADLNRRQNLVAEKLSVNIFAHQSRLANISASGDSQRATLARNLLNDMKTNPAKVMDIIANPEGEEFQTLHRAGLLERDEAASIQLAMSLSKGGKNLLAMDLDEFNVYIKKQVRNK